MNSKRLSMDSYDTGWNGWIPDLREIYHYKLFMLSSSSQRKTGDWAGGEAWVLIGKDLLNLQKPNTGSCPLSPFWEKVSDPAKDLNLFESRILHTVKQSFITGGDKNSTTVHISYAPTHQHKARNTAVNIERKEAPKMLSPMALLYSTCLK